MGRSYTGAITTCQCLQLNINAFTKSIKERREGTGSIEWSSGASITFDMYHSDFITTLTLRYSKKDRGGETHQIRYNVTVISSPSNLGKGRIYYFLCPVTYNRCKILYIGYGSLYFKSREAYKHRIYYASQLSSHLDKHNDKYWSLERKLEKILKRRYKSYYRGKETPISKRITKMKEKRNYHDHMRWNMIPKSILKSMGLHGFTDISDLF